MSDNSSTTNSNHLANAFNVDLEKGIPMDKVRDTESPADKGSFIVNEDSFEKPFKFSGWNSFQISLREYATNASKLISYYFPVNFSVKKQKVVKFNSGILSIFCVFAVSSYFQIPTYVFKNYFQNNLYWKFTGALFSHFLLYTWLYESLVSSFLVVLYAARGIMVGLSIFMITIGLLSASLLCWTYNNVIIYCFGLQVEQATNRRDMDSKRMQTDDNHK